MTGFMPPVRRMQVQSGEPNNLRVGFRRPTLRVIAVHGGVASAPGTLAYTKQENPPTFDPLSLPVIPRGAGGGSGEAGTERAWREPARGSATGCCS